MAIDIVGLVALSTALGAHLTATVWWAASLTRRVDHLERWIDNHAQTAERLAAMEEQIKMLCSTMVRVEHFLQRQP